MSSLRTLAPRARPIAQRFLRTLAQAGIRGSVTSTRRDTVKQTRLYQNYKRCGCSDCNKRPGQAGCVPAAAPGTSTHEKGLAFDLHLEPASAYAWAGQLWKSWGFTWGGDFDDPIHFDFRRRG